MKLYVRKEKDPAPRGQADPYMIRAKDERYYLYPSGGHLFSSDKLTEGWTYEGICLEMPGQNNCWAPCVIELDGTYYYYYSSQNDGCTDDHGQTMRVAVADNPKGPFRYVKDILPPFSIDSHVVKTPSGLYMFYCNNDYDAQRAGTYIACDKMKDPYTMEGAPKRIVLPTIDEEIFMKNRFKQGQHWHTIEGAFYFYHKGIHYVMYSGACYMNPTYFIGYSVAYGPEDADLRELDWKKYPNEHVYAPLMKSNSFVEGVGHNSVIYDGGEWFVVYHGRDYEDEVTRDGEDTRCARIDRMEVNGEKLSVEMTP